MSWRRVELRTRLAVPAEAAREALARVLAGLGNAGDGSGLTLSVPLRDLHVGATGEVAVPVTITHAERRERDETAIRIHAVGNEGIFPTFDGMLAISRLGTHCELWLIGDYRPPLGALGAALDGTALRHAALRSLEAFLTRLGAEIAADAQRSEREHERAMRGMHG